MSITDELRKWAQGIGVTQDNKIWELADRIDEDAKRLCHMAFDGGADYGSTCMQYNCNALAYDWEHWLAKNEQLFRPAPTVEDVLREFADRYLDYEGMPSAGRRGVGEALMDEYAAKLRLAGEGE